MRKILFTFFLAFTLVIPKLSDAQEISLRKADNLLGDNNFERAAEAYLLKLKSDSENPEYLMRIGFCYMNIPNKKDSAISNIQKASELFKSSGKEIQYIESQFYLGQAYRMAYKFEDAETVLNEIKKLTKKKKIFNADIDFEISLCKNGKRYLRDSSNAIVKNIKVINSIFAEHSPILSQNENTLIFTSKREIKGADQLQTDGQYSENIFISKKIKDKWKEPESIGPNLNDKSNNANCGLSPDGKTLFIYKEGDIYETILENTSWSNVLRTKLPVNSKSVESHICVNDAGNIVIFSSNRPGGIGGFDLYKITKDDDSNWSDPINLGKEINTIYDETAPFIHTDGMLYYSSNGEESIGGFDIFSAKSDGNNNYTNRKNLGIPTNSTDDDIFYYLSIDKKRGYFASSRKGSIGRSDIFYIDYSDSSKIYLVVEGNVKKKGAKSDGISVCYFDSKKYEKQASTNTQLAGDYKTVVKKGQEYNILFTAPEYFFEIKTINARKDTTRLQTIKSFELQKIEKGNVNKKYLTDFKSKNDNLNKNNEFFLNTLVDFLNQNPDLKIDIACGNSDKKDLDKKRTETIIKYIKEKGIKEDRIYVNLISVDESSDNAQLTVLDEITRKKAFEDKVLAYKNAFPDDEEVETDGMLTKGIYTIQVGAFSKQLETTNSFFKKLKHKVIIYSSNDKLFRYTYGKYKYITDAEKNLIILQKMGYKDAFVRTISWYKNELKK